MANDPKENVTAGGAANELAPKAGAQAGIAAGMPASGEDSAEEFPAANLALKMLLFGVFMVLITAPLLTLLLTVPRQTVQKKRNLNRKRPDALANNAIAPCHHKALPSEIEGLPSVEVRITPLPEEHRVPLYGMTYMSFSQNRCVCQWTCACGSCTSP